MNGILAGVTVALKQSVPETELKLLMLSIKVKVSFASKNILVSLCSKLCNRI